MLVTTTRYRFCSRLIFPRRAFASGSSGGRNGRRNRQFPGQKNMILKEMQQDGLQRTLWPPNPPFPFYSPSSKRSKSKPFLKAINVQSFPYPTPFTPSSPLNPFLQVPVPYATDLSQSIHDLSSTLSRHLKDLERTMDHRLSSLIDEMRGFVTNTADSNEEEVTRAVASYLGVTDFDLNRRAWDAKGQVLYEADGMIWLPDGRIAVVEAKQKVTRKAVDRFLERLKMIAQIERRKVKGFIGGPLFPPTVRNYAASLQLGTVTLSGNRFGVQPKGTAHRDHHNHDHSDHPAVRHYSKNSRR